ncbi:MAG: type IV toxin-antitoxin system AbiEi family antitoxin domain-containing protein [Gammaproteobacteria bacterium AqS3]|nr:type IV toxin-antitoxin system AbiEi family antitoxin domain-containing protein [Gammaproteobacteria bacterium AqS3]
MPALTEQILAYAEQLPEATPLTAKSLLHLGTRTALHQALSRLVKRGELIRAERGIYFCLIKSRFGTHPPSVGLAVKALGEQRGEPIVQHGAAAANALGLITQVPLRAVYLTSGRSRNLKFGEQIVELRHAPSWQLIFGNRPAGKAIRALDWLGPEHAEKGLKKLKQTLPSAEFEDLVSVASQLPDWLTQIITRAAGNTK